MHQVIRTVRGGVVARRIPEAAINNSMSAPVALAMGGRGYGRESPRSRCNGRSASFSLLRLSSYLSLSLSSSLCLSLFPSIRRRRVFRGRRPGRNDEASPSSSSSLLDRLVQVGRQRKRRDWRWISAGPPCAAAASLPGVGMEPEQRGRTSRASSTSSLGREVRCGCQYYQSDSLLPERRALLVRPSSRTMQQPPAVRCRSVSSTESKSGPTTGNTVSARSRHVGCVKWSLFGRSACPLHRYHIVVALSDRLHRAKPRRETAAAI